MSALEFNGLTIGQVDCFKWFTIVRYICTVSVHRSFSVYKVLFLRLYSFTCSYQVKGQIEICNKHRIYLHIPTTTTFSLQKVIADPGRVCLVSCHHGYASTEAHQLGARELTPSFLAPPNKQKPRTTYTSVSVCIWKPLIKCPLFSLCVYVRMHLFDWTQGLPTDLHPHLFFILR